MNEERKRLASRTVRELYLYPHRAKGENTLRGIVWMFSWIVGIVVQRAATNQTLGGAYVIYAISLLLEFVPESKERPLAQFVHGLFCVLLIIMLLGSSILIFGDGPSGEAAKNGLYLFVANASFYIGWVVFIMMFGGVVLALTEAHKLVYDEESVSQRKNEELQEAERKRFLENLNGAMKGGNPQ